MYIWKIRSLEEDLKKGLSDGECKKYMFFFGVFILFMLILRYPPSLAYPMHRSTFWLHWWGLSPTLIFFLFSLLYSYYIYVKLKWNNFWSRYIPVFCVHSIRAFVFSIFVFFVGLFFPPLKWYMLPDDMVLALYIIIGMFSFIYSTLLTFWIVISFYRLSKE